MRDYSQNKTVLRRSKVTKKPLASFKDYSEKFKNFTHVNHELEVRVLWKEGRGLHEVKKLFCSSLSRVFMFSFSVAEISLSLHLLI